jgi:dipeptidyl aminopeptidase/acylaminoacyl peptidase
MKPARAIPAVVGLCLLGATALAAQTQTPAGTLQPWQVATYQHVTDAQPSPDGRRVAFLRSKPRRPLAEDSGPAWIEIHLLQENGEVTPFVTGEVTASGLAWIDADRLAFLAKRAGDEHKSLYVISASGGEARRVLTHDTDIDSYSFERGGRRVAFLATEQVPEAEEKLEKKGFDQVIYEEDNRSTRLYIAEVALDAAAPTEPLEPTKPRRVELEGSVRWVELSPAGDRLAVKVTPTPLIDDSYVAQRLVVLDLDGKVVAQVTTAGKLGDVAWSPDGRRLAMIGAADLNDPAEGRLQVASATAGGAPVDVLPGLEGHVAAIDWLDSANIAFVAELGTATEVGSVAADGTARRTLLAAGSIVVTKLAATGATGNVRLALLAETPSHPPELYTLSLGTPNAGAVPQRRTDSNPWLAELRLARQEVVRWSARDGLELEGLLIHPLDRREGQRSPLVMIVHGGPEAHYRNGWLTNYSQMGQVAAARGFAVFYPNYRGSTGRGVAFSKLGHADAAGPEFDDLIDGVDHLIEIGLVDRDRVGITGGSYGGYASAWGATYYSERFAAAIPFVGISNNVSKVGTTDIPQEMYDVHHRKWLWQDWDYFLDRSPIRWIERNRTPTLILHGKDDPRVHPSQSLELFRHLKVLGQAPVRLVLYPGEGHGNRKSAGRFDYMLRTLRWMEHYLQGPGGAAPPREIDYEPFLPWAADAAESDDSATSDVTSP